MTTVIVQTWHSHTDDSGNWCDFSGEPISGKDDRCPQGCRASQLDEDELDYEEGYEPCRADDCEEDANDGQGWDGYCGLHSDELDGNGEL